MLKKIKRGMNNQIRKNPTLVGLSLIGMGFYIFQKDLFLSLTKARESATSVGGLGKAGMLGDEDDVSSGHGFQQTGYTGKHAFGNPEPIHPMPSGPKISYRAEDHEQPMMMDPIYEAAKRPRDASMFQPASVRNMDIETTVAQGFESTVFAGIDNVHMF